jgi:hypothetical protein
MRPGLGLMKQGYKLDFKMFLEGIEVPFKSATITCTPNGVEASVNVYSSENVYDLKPKTSVHIFFKEWFGKSPGWRLLFDGEFSGFYEVDEATEGRSLSLVCRDFRMGIRKTPAALAIIGEDSLGSMNMYHKVGIFQTWAAEGLDPTNKSHTIKTIDGKLLPTSEVVSYIAGSAGFKATKQKNGEYGYAGLGGVTRINLKGDDKSRAGLFLDAVVRGLWLESVGGTSTGAFLNKRLRVEKKFLIPVNKAGAMFWSRTNASATLGSYLMGNSVFTTVEAAIMRLGALFNTRVYSCSTPSLIPIDDESTANEYVMDEAVRGFLVNRTGSEFGAKYILNESMLLPPLEFTAPPNCNILFPEMYDRFEWRQDYDIDYTRGYFRLIDQLTAENSEGDPFTISYQVPNELFNSKNASVDKRGRAKPPLTEEEKYKGVNVLFDSVELQLGYLDVGSVMKDTMLTKKARNKLDAEISKIQKKLSASTVKKSTSSLTDVQRATLQNDIDAKNAQKDYLRMGNDPKLDSAIKRHAVIKFLNSKYLGRVASADSMFDPYIMCGFPALIISGSQPDDSKPIKDVIGMVQQIRHSIVMSTVGGDASTNIVLSNPRFVDESTDMDGNGNPYYCRATDKDRAIIDRDEVKYKGEIGIKGARYYVSQPKSLVKVNPEAKGSAYDSLPSEVDSGYIYAKDVLSISQNDFKTDIFIDPTYEVNRIARFYKRVLRHKEDSFMIGSFQKNNKQEFFMYDSIHEAVTNLRGKLPTMDYETCMNYVSRDICSADAFYHGILGASSLGKDGKYVSRKSGFNDSVIDPAYYGVSNDLWDSKSVDELKQDNGGLMENPGDCSSINESMPETYFIKERRDIVEAYLGKVIDSRRHIKYG